VKRVICAQPLHLKSTKGVCSALSAFSTYLFPFLLPNTIGARDKYHPDADVRSLVGKQVAQPFTSVTIKS